MAAANPPRTRLSRQAAGAATTPKPPAVTRRGRGESGTEAGPVRGPERGQGLETPRRLEPGPAASRLPNSITARSRYRGREPARGRCPGPVHGPDRARAPGHDRGRDPDPGRDVAPDPEENL